MNADLETKIQGNSNLYAKLANFTEVTNKKSWFPDKILLEDLIASTFDHLLLKFNK